MNWIRISVAMGDDPRVHALAQRLGVRVAEAIGLLVLLLARFPEHAPQGALADVADTLLEKWAVWEGRRGRFAAEFRALFLSETGVWLAWEKHNGAAQRENLSNRKRAQERRDRARTQLDLSLGAAKSTPDGTPGGAADGKALRTNERTNSSYRARSAGVNGGTAPAFVPGHANLPAGQFCAHCDGELVEVPGSRRPQRMHSRDCPTLVGALTPSLASPPALSVAAGGLA